MKTRVQANHPNPSFSKGGGLVASLFTPWYAGALVCLGLQACVWIMALRYYPLSFAYPFTSLLRGLTLFGAWFFSMNRSIPMKS
jgi:hypothetical protein